MSFMSCVWIQWVYVVCATLSHCYTVNHGRNKTGKQLLNTFTVYVLYKCLLKIPFRANFVVFMVQPIHECKNQMTHNGSFPITATAVMK